MSTVYAICDYIMGPTDPQSRDVDFWAETLIVFPIVISTGFQIGCRFYQDRSKFFLLLNYQRLLTV